MSSLLERIRHNTSEKSPSGSSRRIAQTALKLLERSTSYARRKEEEQSVAVSIEDLFDEDEPTGRHDLGEETYTVAEIQKRLRQEQERREDEFIRVNREQSRYENARHNPNVLVAPDLDSREYGISNYYTQEEDDALLEKIAKEEAENKNNLLK